MIVYQLACDGGHFFEGWFASSQAFERQAASGELQCPACASAKVRKLPSAPYVHASGEGAARPAASDEAALRAKAIKALRRFIVDNTENVGRRFPEIARRIHYNEEKARAIRGLATPLEAHELQEEGVAVYTVPAEVLPTGEAH